MFVKLLKRGFKQHGLSVCKARELCDEAIVGRYMSIVRFRCSLDS